MVKVVKNAAAGMILAPTLTREPTKGKATKAGIKVMAPASAAIMVEIKVLEDPSTLLMESGGIKVKIKPIMKMIPTI